MKSVLDMMLVLLQLCVYSFLIVLLVNGILHTRKAERERELRMAQAKEIYLRPPERQVSKTPEDTPTPPEHPTI